MIDFELVLPDGWVQIPTTPGSTALRRRIIDEVIRHHLPDSLPRDKVGPWRRMLRKELTDATDEAARQSARFFSTAARATGRAPNRSDHR